MTQFPKTNNPIAIVSSGKSFIHLYQVAGLTCSAQAYRNAEEFIAATAAMAGAKWSKNKNFDGNPLNVTDAASAVGACMQMDLGYPAFPLYIEQAEFESSDRWQRDEVVQKAAAMIGMAGTKQRPKGLLERLRTKLQPTQPAS